MKILAAALTISLTMSFACIADDVKLQSTEINPSLTDDKSVADTHDLVRTIKDISGTQRFIEALEHCDMVITLDGLGPFTVFVPLDGAFRAMSKDKVDQLFTDEGRAELTELIRGHVVKGQILLDEKTPESLSTLNGKTVKVEQSGRGPLLNSASIVDTPNIRAQNGVVHLVNGFLSEE